MTSVSVTIVDDRRCICNRTVEAFGSPAKLPVVRQERFLCGAADPARVKQRVRQIMIAEREAPELVGKQKAPAEGFAVVESVRCSQRPSGPVEKPHVEIRDLLEVPGAGDHLRGVSRPFESAAMHRHLALDTVAADQLVDLRSQVVRRDEQAVAERAEAEEAEALTQAVALASARLRQRV